MWGAMKEIKKDLENKGKVGRISFRGIPEEVLSEEMKFKWDLKDERETVHEKGIRGIVF